MAYVFATLSVTLMLILLTLVFYVLVSRLYAFIYRWMRETILKAEAKRRALLLLLLALGAPIIGLVSVFAFILPSFFAFPSLYEHCHASVCGPHVPDYFQSSNYIFALVALVSTLVGFSLFVFFGQQRRLENQIQCLIELLCNEQSIHKSIHNDYLHTINSEYPLLMNAGLISPRIIMSSKTKSQLGAEALQLILMYELIRCKRYDNLRSMIGKIFTIIWPNSLRKIFLNDLSNANHGVARQIVSNKKSKLNNLQCLPKPQEVSGLPIYVRQLVTSYGNEQEQSTGHSILLNPLSFALVAVHYLMLMIALTSLTHYLSDIFL